MRLLKFIREKKEGIKPSSLTTNSPLPPQRSGLHSQSYKDVEDLDIIRCFESDVKG
jgi:hypothetical protein